MYVIYKKVNPKFKTFVDPEYYFEMVGYAKLESTAKQIVNSYNIGTHDDIMYYEKIKDVLTTKDIINKVVIEGLLTNKNDLTVFFIRTTHEEINNLEKDLKNKQFLLVNESRVIFFVDLDPKKDTEETIKNKAYEKIKTINKRNTKRVENDDFGKFWVK